MKFSVLFASFLAVSASFAQTVLMSNGSTTTCSADFYDSGGPASNYGNLENFSHTFFPGTSGEFIQLEFVSYVSGPADQISIYDGPDNTYPLLFNGGGVLSIPTYVSSDFSGALTVEFNSNAAGTQAGWDANVTCCASPQYWFPDADGDGFGDWMTYLYTCTPPGAGYVDNADDCDDAALMYEDWDGDGFGSTTPAGCGSYDNSDCDDFLFTYNDGDGDGFGDPMTLVPCGVADNTDCDDSDNTVGSGIINEYYIDADGDGFGSWDAVAYACSAPPGYVDNSDDCDDFSFTYEDLDGDLFGNPLVMVGCGTYDNSDCDDNLVLHMDFDADGFGDPNVLVPCIGVTDSTDCDDNDGSVGSGAMTAYFPDNDLDGFGDMWTPPFYSCSPVPGLVDNSTDCDDWSITFADNDGDWYGDPSVMVPCGVYDNTDCDDNLHYFNDNDGDGFGDPNYYVACAGVLDSTDCDDYDNTVGGGAMTAYYQDNDADGYGDPWWVFYSCFPVPGMVTDSTDCEDWNYDVNPGVPEIPSNGIDDNCDGNIDESTAGHEEQSMNFRMYPNPAQTEVNISWQSATSTVIEIISMNGQVLFSGKHSAGAITIQVETGSFDPGVYAVRIYSEDRNALNKVLVIQ